MGGQVRLLRRDPATQGLARTKQEKSASRQTISRPFVQGETCAASAIQVLIMDAGTLDALPAGSFGRRAQERRAGNSSAGCTPAHLARGELLPT